MREHCKLNEIESFGSTSAGSLIISLLNVRFFQKHEVDIKHDKDLLQSDILCFTETQLVQNHQYIPSLNEFSFNQNNSIDRFSSLLIRYEQNVCIRYATTH